MSKNIDTNSQFTEGELVIYRNGDTCEIGRIKRVCDDGAFVYYHQGDTASKTPYDVMHKLLNKQCVVAVALGEQCGIIHLFPTGLLKTLVGMNIRFSVLEYTKDNTCSITVMGAEEYSIAYEIGRH